MSKRELDAVKMRHDYLVPYHKLLIVIMITCSGPVNPKFPAEEKQLYRVLLTKTLMNIKAKNLN